jgi:hypothetical protein
MASDQDRFNEIADQLLREDPKFMRRAEALSRAPKPQTRTLLAAMFSLVFGFPALLVCVALDQPLVGLGVFTLMLVLVTRALNQYHRVLLSMVRDAETRFRQRGDR